MNNFIINKMNKTIKSCFLIACLTVTFLTSAQTYRVEVGYNNPQLSGNSLSSTFYNGIRLGGTAEFQLKNNFSLLTGALYNFVYSNKVQGYPSDATVTYATTGHMIDIPVRLIYTYPLTKDLKIFGFAGPKLNIGLAQTMKITSTQTYDSSNPYYVLPGTFNLYGDSGSLQLNRMNVQIGLGGGIQWKRYQIKSGYDFGINNLNRLSTGNLYQNGWYISFAYQF